MAAIDAAMKELNDIWQSISQEMYNAQQQAQPNGGQGFNQQQGGQQNQGGKNGDSEVTDVDFEEVK